MRFVFFALFVSSISCGYKSESDDPILQDPIFIADQSILRIPTVVHVVYFDEASNISDEKIHSQIHSLNLDFRAQNDDLHIVPNEFKTLIADTGIEFYLASEDPEGRPTSGINRRQSQTSSLEDSQFSTRGGIDAWPSEDYLNIWVVDISDRNGNPAGLAGKSQFPGGDPFTDGVLIDYRAFGTIEPLITNHSRGRTATHEIGHWLGLQHIYAKEGDCTEDDGIADTPLQMSQYQGKPAYPSFSCGSQDLLVNFMDYVDDDVMVMFTNGQRNAMRSLFQSGGARASLIKKSDF